MLEPDRCHARLIINASGLGNEVHPPAAFSAGFKRDVSSKDIHTQTTTLDDTFQGTDGNRFVAVPGHNYLPAIVMPPFLVAARLGDTDKSMLT
jgi:hypothetical protein